MTITHVFFDIGGVLGTNGWDHEQRAAAEARFGLGEEFEARHAELVGDWEIGRISLAEYLDSAVFYEPRSFTREAFTAFMLEQSRPFTDAVEVVRELASRGGVTLMTLNNEGAELNRHRIERFGLHGLFDAFLSSCWLGVRKPSRLIFDRAQAIAGATAREILFIDDRLQNIGPADAAGWATYQFTGAAGLRAMLAGRKLL